MINILYLNLPHNDLCNAIKLLEDSKEEFKVFVADTDGIDRNEIFYESIRVFDMPEVTSLEYSTRLETLVEALKIDYIQTAPENVFPRLAKIEEDNK